MYISNVLLFHFDIYLGTSTTPFVLEVIGRREPKKNEKIFEKKVFSQQNSKKKCVQDTVPT